MNFLPHTEEDRREMLKTIGAGSISDLFSDIPRQVRMQKALDIPGPLSEQELTAHLEELGGRNGSLKEYISFLGAGSYDHYIPSVINHMLLRSEFYTAYTPYQPEISQGTLMAIFEYQTMICELTGMDTANASMYDGGTAMAEAALMACGNQRRDRVVVSGTVHPAYREVLKTYAVGQSIEIVEVPYKDGITDLEALEKAADERTAAVIVQQPNFFGVLEKAGEISELIHRNGGLMIVAADPISLGILKPPGAYGADIVVGEGQPLGNPVSFGGPQLGFFACNGKLFRRMPGRIVGQTVDNRGQRAFVLTLQAREQHIRREKATSNICSNEALCALAATIYLTMLGKEGLAETGRLCLQKAHFLQEQLAGIGIKPAFETPFFKEFVVDTGRPVENINRFLLKEKIIGGLDLGRFYPELKNHMLLCVTEKRSREDMLALVKAVEKSLEGGAVRG
ncbi:MAG: aminomethyl-transferring glycine dehydrogenase [Firmicutes bacterium HGW-Firmicutes-14]|nr:MAG: aminomethyl-transferring glycine dehydrogenase [Firmicutes bacterium HGW-Firmicutes-14]